jgi:hypothetical protein
LQRRTTPSSSSATTRRRPVEDGGLVLHEGDELFRLQTQREPFPPPSQHDPGDRQHHAGTGGRGDAAERAGRSSNTLAGSNPTLTSPTGETFAGRTPSAPGGQIGTFARAETPSVPCCHVTTSLPASTSRKSVLTGWPRRRGPVGQSDAVVIGDHDEQGAGARGDVGGQILQRSVLAGAAGCSGIGADLGHRRAHLRIDGDGAGDVQGRSRPRPQLLDAEQHEDEHAGGDDDGDRRQLHEHHPRREPHLVSIMR